MQSEIKLNLLNKEQILELFDHQIVNTGQAAEITGQSIGGFSQSIRQGKVKPLIKFGEGHGSYSLFYRPEIEEYARTKRFSKRKQSIFLYKIRIKNT